MKVWGAAIVLATSTYASTQALASAEFTTQVKGTGEIRLTGWLRLRGEVMLYASREAMQGKRHYPDCISGVFTDQATRKLSGFDGKKVVVSGQLVRFESLGDEETPLLQRKILAGSVIPNFCFGENVVLIKEIKRRDKRLR